MLAPAYRFGYHSLEDIEQHGIYKALIALDEGKYDVGRPLENFAYVHMRNQLSNYRRKHYLRSEPACHCCDPTNPPAFPCQKYADWARRNASKQNIMRTLDLDNVADESEKNMRDEAVVHDDAVINELRTYIDRELPVDVRRDYLLLIEGNSVPKARRDRVREAVIAITRRGGYLDVEDE